MPGEGGLAPGGRSLPGVRPQPFAPPYRVELVLVRSAQEMLAAVKERFVTSDVLLMAAAVGDYRAGKL